MASYLPDTLAHWDPMPQGQSLLFVDIPRSSKEHLGISTTFLNTISQVEIQWIHRIQNIPMYQQYVDRKTRMCERNSGIVHERSLFHGSPKYVDICRSEDGFDIRVANQGVWGKGNYFADSAEDSHSYTFRDGITSCHVVILASVLTGLSCMKSSDTSLTRPPLLPNTSSGLNERYDSVNGPSGRTTIYITYSNGQAYPAYLICYKKVVSGTVQGRGVYSNPLLKTTTITRSGIYDGAQASPKVSSRPYRSAQRIQPRVATTTNTDTTPLIPVCNAGTPDSRPKSDCCQVFGKCCMCLYCLLCLSLVVVAAFVVLFILYKCKVL